RWRPGRTPSRWGMLPGRRCGSYRRRGLSRGSRSLGRFVLIVAGDLAGSPPDQPGVDQRVDIAVQYTVHVAHRQLAAQILHQAVGGQDVVADLASEIDLQLGVFGLAQVVALLLQLELVHLGAELLERGVAI